MNNLINIYNPFRFLNNYMSEGVQGDGMRVARRTENLEKEHGRTTTDTNQ